MKKILQLWIRMTTVYARILPPFIFCIAFAGTFSFVEPIYLKTVRQLFGNNATLALIVLGIVVFTAIGLSLKSVFFDAVSGESQLQYCLGLEDSEFYLLLLMEKAGWYYFYLVMMLIITAYSRKTILLWWILYSVGYLILTYWIYQRACAYLYQGRKKKRRTFWGDRTLLFPCHFLEHHADIELILFGILHRYRSSEGMFCKIGAVVGAFLFPSKSVSETVGLVVYLILSTILVLSNEGYWKFELENVFMIRMAGVSFHKYFLVNLASDLMFNTLALSIVLMIVWQSVMLNVVFFLFSSVIICYCNLLHIFTGIFIDRKNDIFRPLATILGLIIGTFPIFNIAFGVCLYGKLLHRWERIIC